MSGEPTYTAEEVTRMLETYLRSLETAAGSFEISGHDMDIARTTVRGAQRMIALIDEAKREGA